MITDVKAKVEQVSPSVVGEGDMGYATMTKMGQLYTVDWRQKLILSGKMWRTSVGTPGADAAPTQVTGGGAVTHFELEMPEIIMGVEAGYFLALCGLYGSFASLADAASDNLMVLAYADRSQAPVATGTLTVETPDNLLDGAGAFPGRAFSAVTADILDPVPSDILYFSQLLSAGTAVDHIGITVNFEPNIVSWIAGPCQICVHWGGVIATTGMASLVCACVPSSWFPVS